MRTQYSHIRYKGQLCSQSSFISLFSSRNIGREVTVFEEIGKNRMGCLQRKAFIWEAPVFVSSIGWMFCRVVERGGSSGKILSSRQCTYKEVILLDHQVYFVRCT